MPAEVHLYDVATVFEITITDGTSAVDISGFTTKKYRFQKPSQDCLVVDASFKTDGSDGILQYVTVGGDIDEVGCWSLQVRLENADPSQFHSEIVEFEVYENICDASDP